MLLALGLIAADVRFNSLGATRSVLDNLATPLFWLADVPTRISMWGNDNLRSRQELQEDNERLRREALILHGRSQQMASLRAENVRLRALLNSSVLVEDDVLVAELIGIAPDPARHQLILNKGGNDGVYKGQPLVDALGLLGQVTQVSDTRSRVLLITDTTHSIPVQVNRNGVRGIAEGVGLLTELELRHVAATTDIEPGDILVTSGLGGRFPVGYPVAEVVEVVRDPGKAFARVRARPSAQLDRSRHVLLVFTQPTENAP